MSASAAPTESPATADPRLVAFLAPNCPEVFHSVATPNSIWQADPYDVETIHADAREMFEHLLARGGRTPPPPSGTVLVLKGEAGSGKTHLMRAFRTRAHRGDLGYCAYLQMTAEASSYARYMLANLIDGLEQQYDPDGPMQSRTGLARLSAALLESVPSLSKPAMESLRNGECDATRTVDDYADRLRESSRFQHCDLELMRVLLHLERNDGQVHSRALMWVRCQDMRDQDRDWIGGAVPRTDEADPMRMLQQLARLVGAVHGVPLVLLIDQLEDIANQSAPVERFLKVVDAVTAFTDTIPNTVVVLACLEDYFNVNLKNLTKSKQDRLVRNPEPIRLFGNRTREEILAMTARRLAYIYDTAGVDVDESDELYPFRGAELAKLNNLRARDALELLRKHHLHCITIGRWEEPKELVPPPEGPKGPEPAVAENQLDALWNDFHSSFVANLPDEEGALAGILADAIRSAAAELPEGLHFECGPPDGRYLEVETHKPDNGVDKRLVAVCNAPTRGPSFGKQIADLEKRAGELPVAIVRTTDFPKAGKAITQIASMLRRDGQKVLAVDSDWRRMLAFDAFRKRHANRADFRQWQKTARPLGELSSLQKILKLSGLVVPRPPVVPPPPTAPKAVREPDAPMPPGPPDLSTAGSGRILLGSTLALSPNPVTFEMDEFKQHAAFLGGSGSGKTTAALNLIEQLLARGIPAVLVDRKGDLCRYADPTAWERPLADTARTAARKALRDKLDVALYTPGEPNGRPLALPVVPPGFDELHEAERERFAQYAAGALGSMIGFKSGDADKAQRAILAKAIETLAGAEGDAITVPALRDLVERQDDALLNAIGGTYPEKYYKNLGEKLLTLYINHKQLLTGVESLNIDGLLGMGTHARPGRVRLSVISTRFLGDDARLEFWVSQLLVAVSRWCAKSPRPTLHAVFLFDEADRYLPAGMKQPATKAPMEDLLKRARSAGVGMFLATQSPGDLDYKCRDNIRTWLIGRVKEQTAIEKLKPMLAAAKGSVTDKLASQGQGHFYLVRESSVIAVQSQECFVRTEQLPEHDIARLARQSG
jgi:hypothetical protein